MLAIAEKPLLPGFKVGGTIEGWKLAYRGPNPLRDPTKPTATVFKFKKRIMGRPGVTMLAIEHGEDDDAALLILKLSLRLAEMELSARAPVAGHA